MIAHNQGIYQDILAQVYNQFILMILSAIWEDQVLFLVLAEDCLGILDTFGFLQNRRATVFAGKIFTIAQKLR
jgi:hypothetical protein